MKQICAAGMPEPRSFEERFFVLLMRINRLLRQLADQEMLSQTLTPAQMWFLMRLAEAGQPQPISYFADGVFSNRSNATQMIDRLESEGLVVRMKNPSDRRSVLVRLTDHGIARLKEGRACHDELARTLLGPLSEAERRDAIRVLERVLGLLEAYQHTRGAAAAESQSQSH